MKRTNLLGRLAFLTDKQEALVRAAREFVRAEAANPGSDHQGDTARRELFRAGVEIGLACRRYLGGRE